MRLFGRQSETANSSSSPQVARAAIRSERWLAPHSGKLKLLALVLIALQGMSGFAQIADDQGVAVMEPVPDKALLAVNTTTRTQRFLPDGTLVRLNEERDTLHIERFSQRQEVKLLQKVDSIAGVSGDFVSFDLPSNSSIQTVMTVHIRTGRRFLLSSLDSMHSRSEVEGVPLWYDQNQVLIPDAVSGDVKRLTRPSGTGESGISFSGVKTTRGTIIGIDGISSLVVVSENAPIRLIPLPDKVDASSCSQKSGDYIQCRMDESEGAHFLLLGEELKPVMSQGSWIGYNPETQRALIGPDLSRGYVPQDFMSQLAIHDLKSDRVTPLAMKAKNLENKVRFMTEAKGRGFLVWVENGEARLVSREDLWGAVDHQSADELAKAGKLLGQAGALEELGGIVGELFSQRKIGSPWEWSSEGSVLTYWRTDRPESRRSLHLGSYVSIDPLGESDFAQLSLSNGSNSFVMVLDLKSGKIYEIGNSWGEVELSKDGSRMLVTSYGAQWLISVQNLRTSPAGWRSKLHSLPARPELAVAAFNQCGFRDVEPNHGLAADLLRLREPGAKIYEADLRRFLSYRLTKSETILLGQVLQRFLLEYEDQARLSFRRLGLFSRFEPWAASLIENPCLGEYEEAIIKMRLEQAFTGQNSSGDPTSTDFNGIRHLIVLAPYIKKYGFSEDNHVEGLAEKLARGAEQHPQLKGLFYSKLFYFSKAIIGPIFGQPRKFKTDITFKMDGSVADVLLLSTMPTTGSRVGRNSFGFYHRITSRLDLRQGAGAGVATRRYSWRSDGRKFNADIAISKTGDLRDLVPATDSLDHQALRQDGKLVGMMVAGTNLGERLAKLSLSQYMGYYFEQGYRFGSPQVIEHFPQVMAEKIASGEIDYLIKEAHSDGDEKNLFRASGRARVATGRKKDQDGVEHTVYLVIPEYDGTGSSSADELIANQQFGEWIRTREQQGAGPLVYINASCSSYYKAVNEITAARSKNLVMIPSVTSVTAFDNKSDEATANLITGILKGQTWAEMRESMNRNEKVKQGMIDLFALPNEEKYESQIRQSLSVTADAKVTITDATTGEEINIDEFNRH